MCCCCMCRERILFLRYVQFMTFYYRFEAILLTFIVGSKLMDPQTTLMTIPLDLHLEILSFVPARHLLVYSRCCKHFKTVTEDDRLWWTTKAAIPVCIGAGDAPEARLCVTAVVSLNPSYCFLYPFTFAYTALY